MGREENAEALAFLGSQKQGSHARAMNGIQGELWSEVVLGSNPDSTLLYMGDLDQVAGLIALLHGKTIT